MVIRRKYDKCARIRRGFKLCFFSVVVGFAFFPRRPRHSRGLSDEHRNDAYMLLWALSKVFFSFLFSLFLRPLPQVQRFRTRRRRRLVCKVIIVITRHGTEQNDGAWSFRSFRALSWLIDPRPAESLPSHHSLAGVWNTFDDLYRLDCGLSWARSPSH